MEHETLHARIFDAIRDPLVVINDHGDVHAANAAALRLFDLSVGALQVAGIATARWFQSPPGFIVQRVLVVFGTRAGDPDPRYTGFALARVRNDWGERRQPT